MRNSSIYKLVTRDVLLLVLFIIAMKLTYGVFIFAIILAGCSFALKGNGGRAVFCFVSLFLIQNINFALVPMTIFTSLGCKTGFMLMALSAYSKNTRHTRFEKLPFGALWAYLLILSISSMTGYFPLISYLKLFNFAFFMFATCMMVRCAQVNDESLLEARAAFLSVALIMVIGSLAMYFFPDVGYSMNIRYMQRHGFYVSGQQMLESKDSLFNGMTWHSQALAPMVAISFMYVAIDMFFIEQRIRLIHLGMLIASPIVMFMTRSRTAMLSVAVGMCVFIMYAQGKVNLPRRTKTHIKLIVATFVLVAIGIGTYLEIKDDVFLRWIRKTEDVETDTRTLTDAISSTRMGAVEENTEDFINNPILGVGFQVSRNLKDFYQEGTWVSIFTAPVEKGITPLVVFAEGGILGGLCFIVFVVLFYASCARRRNIALAILFSVILASNMGEATFFAPSGAGGYLWVFTFLGGLVADVSIKVEAQTHKMVTYAI